MQDGAARKTSIAGAGYASISVDVTAAMESRAFTRIIPRAGATQGGGWRNRDWTKDVERLVNGAVAGTRYTAVSIEITGARLRAAMTSIVGTTVAASVDRRINLPRSVVRGWSRNRVACGNRHYGWSW
jgi:hypothetical protein